MAGSMQLEYEKDGAEIYRQSFAAIAREADLARFAASEKPVVIRMIHACGMVDLAGDIVMSSNAIEAGLGALENCKPIICDVEMVRRGIISSRLGEGNNVLCNITSDEAKDYALKHSTTRSAGCMESLREDMTGAIVVIGNAPTALFHLLEMLADGLKPPALIVGCPVGFVGAVESKEALIEYSGDVPFITVRGRRGGSAIAASVVNALAGGA